METTGSPPRTPYMEQVDISGYDITDQDEDDVGLTSQDDST